MGVGARGCGLVVVGDWVGLPYGFGCLIRIRDCECREDIVGYGSVLLFLKIFLISFFGIASGGIYLLLSIARSSFLLISLILYPGKREVDGGGEREGKMGGKTRVEGKKGRRR